ncbi:MAG: AMP-binding protein, partial [Caulobacteraceae bacterium]
MADASVIEQPGLDALEARVKAAAERGMQPSVWAKLTPDRVAIYDYTGQNRTFGQLNANANRVARLLRQAGLRAGDAVALACSNRAEFCDVLLAVLRVGMRCTPVNWHLTGEEIGYVVKDCEAKAFFADARIGAAAEIAAAQCGTLLLKVAIGGPVAGFSDYEAALAPLNAEDIADPVRGYTMLYTSGTTGRPKGVYKPAAAYG